MSRGPPIIHVGQFSSSGPQSFAANLPGCRASLVTSQSVTSSGSPGLNQILGGGVPVGAVLVFEENPLSLHSQRFLHIFAAEGLALGHRVAVATPPGGSLLADFVSLIPSRPVDADGGESGKDSVGDGADPESLRIAWRYENTPKVSPTVGPRSSSSATAAGLSNEPEYDLGKRLDPSKTTGIRCFDPASDASHPDHLQALISWLARESAATGPKNLLRIVLPSIDSPLWCHDLPRMLFLLRRLARNSNTAICLTVSRELHDPAELHRVRRLADAYVSLETLSLQPARSSPMYRDFQAICRIQKGFSINCLRPPSVTEHEFGLRIKKRRMTLERLHLPPAGHDNNTTITTANRHASVGLNCQSVSEKGLEF